jgi:hypothetical protein
MSSSSTNSEETAVTTKFVANFVTVDPANDEFVLYLVEEGNWPADVTEQRLRSVQERLYDAVDVALDGHLATRFPESSGRNVRIQVDYPGTVAPEIEHLVAAMDELVKSDPQYRVAIGPGHFVKALRVVTRQQMGRQ